MAASTGGGSGTEQRGGRRPNIRLRPISPPRAATRPVATPTWTLPAVHAPQPRQGSSVRPVLALVEQDEPVEVEIPAAALPARFWSRPPAAWVVVASFVLVAVATFVAQQALGSGHDASVAAAGAAGAAAPPVATSVLETTSAPLGEASGVRAASALPQAAASIPVVDVKSLPSAPQARARATH